MTPESDTREWHKRVILESTTVEWHWEWHWRVTPEWHQRMTLRDHYTCQSAPMSLGRANLNFSCSLFNANISSPLRVGRCGCRRKTCEKLAEKMSRQDFWDLIYVPGNKEQKIIFMGDFLWHPFKKPFNNHCCIFWPQLIVWLPRKKADQGEEDVSVTQ